MANEMFDEVRQSLLQKITSAELNARELLRDSTVLEAFGGLCGLRSTSYGAGSNPGLADRAWACLEPGSFLLTKVGAFSLTLGHGLGICRDNLAGWVAEARSTYRWLYFESDQAVTVTPCIGGGNTRIDIVLIRPALYQAESAIVEIKNPVTEEYSGVANFTRLRQALRWGTYPQFLAGTADICVKEGTEGVVPVEPTVDAGAVKAWMFLVSTADTLIQKDWRRTPRVRSNPRMVLYIDMTTAGAFNPATDVLSLAEEGIFLRNVTRNGVGDYIVQWWGTPGPTRPLIRVCGELPSDAFVNLYGALDCGVFGAWPQRGSGAAQETVSIYCEHQFKTYDVSVAGATDSGKVYFEVIDSDYDGGVGA